MVAMFELCFGSITKMNFIKKYSNYIYAALIMIGFAIFLNGLAFILTAQEPAPIDTFVSYNKVTMKASDAESVLAVISAEGFDNAFNHQSTFRDINDVKFHELRRAYIATSKELANYLADAVKDNNKLPYYMTYDQ